MRNNPRTFYGHALVWFYERSGETHRFVRRRTLWEHTVNMFWERTCTGVSTRNKFIFIPREVMRIDILIRKYQCTNPVNRGITRFVRRVYYVPWMRMASGYVITSITAVRSLIFFQTSRNTLNRRISLITETEGLANFSAI